MKRIISALLLALFVMNCISMPVTAATRTLDKPVLTITVNNKTVLFQWEKVEGATAYTVYYKQKGDKDYIKAITTGGTRYALGNLSYGTYYMCVRALQKNNGKTVAYSTSTIQTVNVKNPYKQKTIAEFSEYLQRKYPVLKTPLGDIKVNYDHYSDNSSLWAHSIINIDGKTIYNYVQPYDYSLTCCGWIFFDGLYKELQRGEISQEDYDITLGATAYLQQCVFKEAQKYLNGKKIRCSMAMYGYGQNVVGQKYFAWTNYTPNENYYGYYETEAVNTMNWKRAENGGDYFVKKSANYYINKYLEYRKSL